MIRLFNNFFREEVEVKDEKPRRTPEERARELLDGHLSDHQRRTLVRSGFFLVRGKNGKFYVLTDGWRFFSLSKRGEVQFEHHAGPQHLYEYLPVADRLLAQKLLLESNPSLLLKTACRYGRAGKVYELENFKRSLPPRRSWMSIIRR